MTNISVPAYMLEQFFDFCTERHAIYVRRFEHKDPFPWTDDQILNTCKFTNIFRELDSGTIYCRQYIREPYADHPELFFNICLYRLHNKITTQQYLGNFIEDYNSSTVINKLRIFRDLGNTIFTGAYMITSRLGGDDKIEGIFGNAAGQLWDRRRELEPQPGDTLEMAFDRLHGSVPGMGPFNAYEMITDLRWTKYLEDAADIYEWANPGPGAKRGVARIIRDGTVNVKGISNNDCLHVMRYLLAVHDEYVPEWFPTMEMRDIEHALCEFDKYLRVKNSEGRVRGKFTPPNEQ